MKWMKKNLRTASCTKLYEIAVRRCTKCCTKSVFKTLREGILAAGPFENKGFRTCAGVRSGLYFLPHGESIVVTTSNHRMVNSMKKPADPDGSAGELGRYVPCFPSC